MRQQVTVKPEWMTRSRQFAERSVLGYERGEKEASRAYARPGIDKSVDAQLLGKAGECAFCQFIRVDAFTELDWTPRTDHGWDLIWRSRKIDVKATDTECLIWPVTKGWLADCKAYMFVLARRLRRDQPDIFEISGWITVKDFIKLHHVAEEAHRFDTGTQYMEMDELTEFTDATRAGYPNGFVGYSKEGHFVHYCHCGKEAGFGFGVSLRKGQLGIWYCHEHSRQHQGTTGPARY